MWGGKKSAPARGARKILPILRISKIKVLKHPKPIYVLKIYLLVQVKNVHIHVHVEITIAMNCHALNNVATRPGLLHDNLSHGMEMANLQSSLARVASDDPPAPHHKDASPPACAERRPWLKRRSDAALWAQVCVQWRREELFDERI